MRGRLAAPVQCFGVSGWSGAGTTPSDKNNPDLLRDNLPVSLSLEEIADRLYLSPRTIHRRLEEEGASFRTIKDALRRDLALARLTKTQRSIAQIAGELGYADTSAFYRAVVDWTGISPVQYRKRLQSEKP